MHDHSLSARYEETKKVTLIGSFVDLFLGVIKISVGFLGNSQALIADGIHSLSDLATDIIVLIAAKHANREADENHPYGHGRIETLATVVLGISLIAIAIGICVDAIIKLAEQQFLVPTIAALFVALISIVAKEAIYHYTIRYARKIRSKMLEANAWHSRTDSISSIVVVVGILGAMSGMAFLDAIAAIVVALIILVIGWRFAWNSVRELVDTALDPHEIEKIDQTIKQVSGVEDSHFLRTRSMGADALVDVHIQVDSELSVSEGHAISETVRHQLIQQIETVSDVMVHIDPENDEENMNDCCKLPLRKKLLEQLNQQWHTISQAKEIKKITLHYLEGKIIVDLHLPLDVCENTEQIKALTLQLRQACLKHPDVSKVRVYFFDNAL